jgi:hypothetical protein
MRESGVAAHARLTCLLLSFDISQSCPDPQEAAGACSAQGFHVALKF